MACASAFKEAPIDFIPKLKNARASELKVTNKIKGMQRNNREDCVVKINNKFSLNTARDAACDDDGVFKVQYQGGASHYAYLLLLNSDDSS